MHGFPTPVSDLLSNFNDQIAQAARLIGYSKLRQAIFEFVYRGKKQIKTIREISKATRKSEVHVLKEGRVMAGLLLEKIPGGYKKRRELSPYYTKILALARDKKKLEKLSTKIHPKTTVNAGRVFIPFPHLAQNAQFITINDIKSFSKVRSQTKGLPVSNLKEDDIKNFFKNVLKERGTFKDWGGEKSDLYTTKVYLKNTRIATAIAFKGRGTKGKLVPSKMGKSGDQIERLFSEPAQLFLVVYNGQIESSIISQMQAFAIGKAISGKIIYYGVIDGDDLSRLASAYPDYF